MMYPNIFNVLVEKGQTMPLVYDTLLNPYDTDDVVEKTEELFKKIKIPFYTGTGWYAYSYKLHLQGSQQWFQNVNGVPKKLLFTGPAHLERPFHSFHDEILRWYDHWLKGKHNRRHRGAPGQGLGDGREQMALRGRLAAAGNEMDQALPPSWGRLRPEPRAPARATAAWSPTPFVQMPPTQTNDVTRLRYMTDPLPEDILVIGPSALYLHAAIDQDDTNWIVILKDVGPDVSVRTARPGEVDVPKDLPERELTRGWLKASHRAVDLRAVEAVAALASAHARGAEKGRARRSQRIRHRDSIDGQSVQGGPSNLHRHHQHGYAERARRRARCRIRAVSPMQQQDDRPQNLSRRATPSRICCCRSFRLSERSRLHRRLDRIRQHYGATFEDLANIRIWSRAPAAIAVMAASGKNGLVTARVQGMVRGASNIGGLSGHRVRPRTKS